jgi:DNA-binding transcriptional LysR family regulator
MKVNDKACVAAMRKIGRDVLIPVSAADDQGQALHRLGGSKARPVQVLGHGPESGIGRILREVRGAAIERMPVQTTFTAQLASVLRTMARDGRGMSWLPETLVREDLGSGRLVPAASDDWRVASWRCGCSEIGPRSAGRRRCSGKQSAVFDRW